MYDGAPRLTCSAAAAAAAAAAASLAGDLAREVGTGSGVDTAFTAAAAAAAVGAAAEDARTGVGGDPLDVWADLDAGGVWSFLRTRAGACMRVLSVCVLVLCVCVCVCVCEGDQVVTAAGLLAPLLCKACCSTGDA